MITDRKIQPADLVIANILAGPLKELAPRIVALCKKDLILSGILKTEAQTIIDFYSKNMKFIKQYSTDEWVLLHFEKKT
jgi:ribosomal protein L11 methyltransferase